MSTGNKIEGLSEHVGSLSRDPFRDILTDMLDCRPSRDRLQELAEKDPVNWTKSVAVMANLAGYQRDHTENINVNLRTADVRDMDYGSLLRTVRELKQELETEIIDVSPEQEE